MTLDVLGEAIEAFLARGETDLFAYSIDASWAAPRFAHLRCPASHPESGRRCFYGRGHEVDHEALGRTQPVERWSR